MKIPNRCRAAAGLVAGLVVASILWAAPPSESRAAGAVRASLLVDDTDTVLVIGEVRRVLGASAVEVGDVVVSVDGDTVFDGVAELAELVVGDLVEVEARRRDGDLLARRLTLLEAAPPAVVVDGAVAVVRPPDSLVLDSGTVVRTTPATVWEGRAGLDDLRVGDRVRVQGAWHPSLARIEATSVELLVAAGATPVALSGLVESVTEDRLRLASGIEVWTDDATRFHGVGSLGELRFADEVWVGALTTSEARVFAATVVTLVARASEEVAFVSVIADLDLPARFDTLDGHTVLLGDLTQLVGVDSPDDLRVGQAVAVHGTLASSPLEVAAAVVEVTAGEDGAGGEGGEDSFTDTWGGLESLLVGVVTTLDPPQRFVIDARSLVTTDEDTQWAGDLTGYEDLREGQVVALDLVLAHGLVARVVANVGLPDATAVELAGTVVAVDAGERLQLDGGQWLVVGPRTVIDGDVGGVDEIDEGVALRATAVALGGDDFLALRLVVEIGYGDLPLPWSTPSLADEALVVLVDGADPWAVAERAGATIIGSLPGQLVHLFRWPGSPSDDELQTLYDDPEVVDVGPNYDFTDPESIRRRFPVVDRAPSSVDYAQQAAVTAVGLAQAHARTRGAGTVVAVIDTGVDPDHPLLRHRLATGGWDFVDGDDGPWESRDGLDQDLDLDVDESAGHGTFVAGLVLLTAPGARILPYRVLDDDGHGTTFAICQAVVAAMDRGVDVINLSLAYDARPRVLDRLLDEAAARGIVLVAGAGNDGTSALPFPAADHRVLAVAAVEPDGSAAAFSNRGPECALSAPGVELYSACADGEWCTWSGTSMAAPLVSGAAALLRSVDPTLTPDQIREALVQAAVVGGDDLPPRLQVSAALDLIPSWP